MERKLFRKHPTQIKIGKHCEGQQHEAAFPHAMVVGHPIFFPQLLVDHDNPHGSINQHHVYDVQEHEMESKQPPIESWGSPQLVVSR